jgi:hypothetical protein
VASIPESVITTLTAVITVLISSFFKREGYLDYVYKAKPTADYQLGSIKPLLTLKKAAPKA